MKAQIQALLAIRWLGQHPTEARQAGVESVLKKLALSKANDPHGFLNSHATHALARIEGKPLPGQPALPVGSVRGDALGAADPKISRPIARSSRAAPFSTCDDE